MYLNEQKRKREKKDAKITEVMKVIAIDLGATSGRVMVVTHKGGLFSLDECARFLNKTYTDEKGYLRWDFPYLLENVKSGIKEALKKHPDAASIGIDTWGVDYGLIKDGKLISDPVCYRDAHSFVSQKETLQKMPFSKIYELTGIQNLHFNTIYQLGCDPNDSNNADSLLLIPDLLAYFLTGEKKMEETNASTTSLYSYERREVIKELLDLSKTPANLFPPMIFPGEKYGCLIDECLPDSSYKRIPVLAVPTHDTASAVLGASGSGDFAYISSGTWSLIGTELDHKIANDKSREYNFTNEIGYNHTIRFLKNEMGMFLVNEIRNDYRNKGIDIGVDDIVPLVNEAKDMPFLIDVDDPIFEQPNDMLAKLDSYLKKHDIDVEMSPGETIKLIYKSMAEKYAAVIKRLEELTSKKITSILIVGGGNQASLLNQYIADATGKIVITGASEATVLGNALAQFIALKDVVDVKTGREEIAASFPKKEYFPQK